MRLGVDIRCLQDSYRTGVGEYVWQVLQQLAANTALELGGFANAAKPIDLPESLNKLMQVKRGRLPNKLMNLRFWLKLGTTIDELLARAGFRPDVMWLPNPGFSFVSAKMPTLLTVHDLSCMHYPSFFPIKGRLWYFPAVRALLRNGLPERALIAAVSQHTAEDIRQTFPQLKKIIRVVPPGLDEKFFVLPGQLQQQTVRQKYKLPERYLLALGTVEPRKNYAVLLKAYYQILKKNPGFDYDLVIAGNWGWRYQPLKKLWTDLALHKRVHFIGYVTNEDKPALYAQAIIFLYPSFYEGIGLPVLEAMATGRPVICSHNASLPEIVGPAGLLLSPHQPELWAEAIVLLINDERTRRFYAELAQDWVKQYSWTKTAQTYAQLLGELSVI